MSINKNKFEFSILSDDELQNLECNLLFVPLSSKINDQRKVNDFKTLTFCGALKTQVLTALGKSIAEEKLEASNFWAFQLLLSGCITSLFDRLINISAKQINISNPKLPTFILNKKKKLETLLQIHNSKDYHLVLRNNQDLRHLLVELVSAITLSRKRKLESLPKLKQSDFNIQMFKTRLESNNSNDIKHILKENDPSEIRIAANELLYQLINKNMNKGLYWLSWILEWEKIHIKKYKIFKVSSRNYEGIEGKFGNNIIWLVWDIINYVRKSSFDIPLPGLQELDSLWNLYKLNFNLGSRSKKIIYIIWSMKILTSYVDWDLKLIEREYLYFHSIANVNLMIKKLKPNEINHNVYNDVKYKIVVKNNYITSQNARELEHQKQNKIIKKKQDKRIKEAKKKKISINSLDKLEQLKKMDKYLNY